MKCPNCKVELARRNFGPIEMFKCLLCPFVTSRNEKKAEYLYAALSVDDQGNEGIMATTQSSPQGTIAMTMVATKKELVESLLTKDFKKDVEESGFRVKLAKFKRVD